MGQCSLLVQQLAHIASSKLTELELEDSISLLLRKAKTTRTITLGIGKRCFCLGLVWGRPDQFYNVVR